MALYSAGILASALNAVLLWPFLARIATPVQVGELVAALSIASALTPVTTLGVGVFILRESQTDSDEVREQVMLTSNLCGRLLRSCGYILALAALPMSLTLAAGVLATVAAAQTVVKTSELRGRDASLRFWFAVLMGQSLSLMLIPVYLRFCAWLEWPSDWRAGLILASICSVEFTHRLAKFGGGDTSSRARAWRAYGSAIRFGIRYVPNLILVVLLTQSVRLMSALQLGAAQLAALQFAVVVGSVPYSVVQSISGTISVDSFRLARVEAIDLLGERHKRLSLLALASQAVLTAASSAIFFRLLPRAYDAAEIATAATWILAAGPAAVWAEYEAGRAAFDRRARSLTVATSSAVVVQLISIPLLAHWLGLVGAAVGFAAGIGARAIVGFALNRQAPKDEQTPHRLLVATLAGASLALINQLWPR